jgi:hypothetical protein
MEDIMKKLFGMFLLSMFLVMAASSAEASIFATDLVDKSESLNGSGWYNDPNDLIGKPTITIPGGFGNPAGGPVSIIEPAFGDNRITTFNNGDWAVVGFDHQVMNDPLNPYGLDFIVYGNAFFAGGGGFVNANTDHRTFAIDGGIFEEKLKIAVSQGAVEAGQDPSDQSTWNWYTYDDGPYGDSYYPTNPSVWDPDLWDATVGEPGGPSGWSDPLQENDFAKPVDPSLTGADFGAAGNSYAAMLLYEGSAGGAGFDLDEFDLDWIQYVKVEGVAGFSGGEIDAFSDVAPVPIPGSVLLLGSGLLALLGIRRRRHD